MDLETVISHIRDREYMAGIDRDKSRVKQTEECFTPTWLVQKGLQEYESLIPDIFSNPYKTFIDNSCGDGQFLGEVLIRKMERLCEHRDYIVKSQKSIGNTISDEQRYQWFEEDFAQALSTIYGVDLMPDNVKLCRERLLCGREYLRPIVEQNIVCADALRYHYRFDGSDPYDPIETLSPCGKFNELFTIEE